jgi:hypothetical protein
MLFLPIVDRELRVAARNWRTYFGRVAAGAAALATALYLVWLARFTFAGMAGLFILKAAAYLAWALCLLGGVTRTCDSLSSEKRSETLGLLFLTHLRGRDVVLGKLFAHGLTALYSLVAVIPILSIPVLLGGVSGADLLRIPVALLNSLFLAASLGLLVSSALRGQRAASAAAGGAVVFLAIILPVAAQIFEHEYARADVARCLRLLSPLSAMEMSFNSGLALSGKDFWLAVTLQFGLSLAALAVACRLAAFSWKVQSNLLWTITAKIARYTQGNPIQQARRRTGLLSINPFLWLAYRDRLAPLWPLLFVASLVGATLWLNYYYELPRGPSFVLLLAALALSDLAIRMRVASLGANRLAQDRQSGALELILSTTAQPDDIIHGLWKSIRRIQLPAYSLMFLSYVLVVSAFLDEMEPTQEACAVFGTLALVSIGDFIVLGYVAMWQGLRVSNLRQAAGTALVRVLVLPWVAFIGFIPLVAEVDWLTDLFENTEPYGFLLAALLVWGTNAATAYRSARRNLRDHFRVVATDREHFIKHYDPARWIRLIPVFRTSGSDPAPPAPNVLLQPGAKDPKNSLRVI